MTNNTAPTFEIVTWKEVRTKVHKVNPKLAKIIDDLDPNDSYKLYRIRYPFGAMVFDQAVLNLPNSAGQLVPLTHHTIPDKIKEDLSYRTIPIGLSVDKMLEVHMEIQDRIIPLTVMTEGTPFGVWEALDPVHSYFIKLSWTLSSGARSLFMLPKIAEASGYHRLQKEFGVLVNAPKYLKDQWHIFKSIANAKNFNQEWHSEVLFFSKKWFEQLHKKNAWPKLKDYFYETVWQQSMFWRFSATFNLVWQQFALIVKSKNIKCGAYQLETLKHLITVGVGALPCFTSGKYAESAGPINDLKKIFLDCYGLDYVPTFMFPHHLSLEEKDEFGYYSLNEPTLIESVPKNREVSNIMQVTREIKQLFDRFKEEVIQGNLKIENTPMYDLIEKAQFEFVHTSYDPASNLLLSSRLPDKDKSLVAMPENYPNREFCCSSNFLRGCVRILF